MTIREKAIRYCREVYPSWWASQKYDGMFVCYEPIYRYLKSLSNERFERETTDKMKAEFKEYEEMNYSA